MVPFLANLSSFVFVSIDYIREYADDDGKAKRKKMNVFSIRNYLSVLFWFCSDFGNFIIRRKYSDPATIILTVSWQFEYLNSLEARQL